MDEKTKRYLLFLLLISIPQISDAKRVVVKSTIGAGGAVVRTSDLGGKQGYISLPSLDAAVATVPDQEVEVGILAGDMVRRGLEFKSYPIGVKVNYNIATLPLGPVRFFWGPTSSYLIHWNDSLVRYDMGIGLRAGFVINYSILNLKLYTLSLFDYSYTKQDESRSYFGGTFGVGGELNLRFWKKE